MSTLPASDWYTADGEPRRMGFFTDTSICIGCKACEVACKTWNDVPSTGFEFTGESMDNTFDLGADTWRHVAFIEQPGMGAPMPGLDWFGDPSERATPSGTPPPIGGSPIGGIRDERWLMASDVCKHCSEAGCLDVCPTGSIFRTEFDTVVVQGDICNGCGYCVTACPFGVIERRESDGRAFKCTLCYDRSLDGLEPACSKACPTKSIQFGPLDELRKRARGRVDYLVEVGHPEARLYGDDPNDGVGGFGAFFLLLDEPEVYGLPPDPMDPTRNVKGSWATALGAAVALAAGIVAVFAGEKRPRAGRGGVRGVSPRSIMRGSRS